MKRRDANTGAVEKSFTAALVAGGASRRMGQDKAFLLIEWEGDSVPLWKRQLSVLRRIAPAELVISGPRKQGYPSGLLVLPDHWGNAGPLGGIATCLQQTRCDLLLVLAVDLPHIQPGFLKKLLARSQAGCGAVPILKKHFEPLVAVYPKSALEVAIAQLGTGDYILQNFVNRLIENRLVRGYEVPRSEQNQLENWNTPEDLSFQA